MNTGFVISCVTGQITSPEIHLHLKNKYDAHLVVVFEDQNAYDNTGKVPRHSGNSEKVVVPGPSVNGCSWINLSLTSPPAMIFDNSTLKCGLL